METQEQILKEQRLKIETLRYRILLRYYELLLTLDVMTQPNEVKTLMGYINTLERYAKKYETKPVKKKSGKRKEHIDEIPVTDENTGSEETDYMPDNPSNLFDLLEDSDETYPPEADVLPTDIDDFLRAGYARYLKQKENKEYQIMWATGPKQYDIVKEKLEENRISINNVENAKIVPYIYNMEEMINISDLIVARSGAMTITEISNLGKPSILIPLPNVSHNHQLYNAQVLEKIGAAKIILDNELKGENLQKTIMQILQGNTVKTMGNIALKAETKDAEDRIYNEIVQLVRKE